MPRPRALLAPASEATALVVADLDPALLARSEAMAERPRSAATSQAYASDWRTFTTWCKGFGLSSLPAAEGQIAGGLVALRDLGLRHSSIARSYASIRATPAPPAARP